VVANGVQGYAGIGFSPSGGMPGSDIIMGWFTDNGHFILNDYYAEKSTAP
ncbi:unnamed protein product, partial [Allacma fusca]